MATILRFFIVNDNIANLQRFHSLIGATWIASKYITCDDVGLKSAVKFKKQVLLEKYIDMIYAIKDLESSSVEFQLGNPT